MTDRHSSPPRSAGRPHALTLERYLLGELAPAEQAAVDDALRADPTLAARVEAMRAEDAELRARYPAAALVPGLRAQLAAARRPLHRQPAAWAGLAAAAVAAFALLPAALPPAGMAPAGAGPAARLGAPAAPIVEDTVAKGDLNADLLLYRQVGAAIEPLTDGALARAGDVIGLAYQAADALHGVILSVDGRGAVTLHLPVGEVGSTALTAGGIVNLPAAYQLDDAPAFERFVLVTAAAPIDVGAVLDAARALPPAEADRAPLRLPAGLDQRSLLLRKADSDAILRAPAP